MSDFEDGKSYTAQHARALSTEECEAWFGLDPGEWAQVKRDIVKGSKRFWAKRGLPEPNGGWQAWNDMISEKAAARRGRRKGEANDENETVLINDGPSDDAMRMREDVDCGAHDSDRSERGNA
jgi:hypothetical protein